MDLKPSVNELLNAFINKDEVERFLKTPVQIREFFDHFKLILKKYHVIQNLE
jgi:hypothetical protein